MAEEKLRVLSPREATGRRVIRRDSPNSVGPLFVSWGHFDLLCGACSYLLMSRLPRGADLLATVAIECPNCLALNGG